MNTGLTSLFSVYVCIQENTYFIPQKHQSNEEEPGIHARAVSAKDTCKTFGLHTERKKIQQPNLKRWNTPITLFSTYSQSSRTQIRRKNLF